MYRWRRELRFAGWYFPDYDEHSTKKFVSTLHNKIPWRNYWRERWFYVHEFTNIGWGNKSMRFNTKLLPCKLSLTFRRFTWTLAFRDTHPVHYVSLYVTKSPRHTMTFNWVVLVFIDRQSPFKSPYTALISPHSGAGYTEHKSLHWCAVRVRAVPGERQGGPNGMCLRNTL